MDPREIDLTLSGAQESELPTPDQQPILQTCIWGFSGAGRSSALSQARKERGANS